MRHAKKGRKVGTSASHRKAILNSLVTQAFQHERIETTEAKAKEVRPLIDKVVTLAKRGDVHARRQVVAIVGNKQVAHKIFSEVAPRFEEREGGYTRILKLGLRRGDKAPMAIIELV